MVVILSLWFVVPNKVRQNNHERELEMTRINLGERNQLMLSIEAEQYKVEVEREVELKKQEKQSVNSNDTAKREMATELINQGFSEEAICRILHISPDQMPEACSYDDL